MRQQRLGGVGDRPVRARPAAPTISDPEAPPYSTLMLRRLESAIGDPTLTQLHCAFCWSTPVLYYVRACTFKSLHTSIIMNKVRYCLHDYIRRRHSSHLDLCSELEAAGGFESRTLPHAIRMPWMLAKTLHQRNESAHRFLIAFCSFSIVIDSWATL